MSENAIVFIPADHLHVPEQKRLDAVTKLLADELQIADPSDKWSGVTVEIHEHPVAVTPFENFVSVRCPFCLDEAGEWWGEAIDRAMQTDFRSHALRAPCCDVVTTLNQLLFQGPMGFARCVISVGNADHGLFTPEIVDEVESLLDCGVRVIHQHI